MMLIRCDEKFALFTEYWSRGRVWTRIRDLDYQDASLARSDDAVRFCNSTLEAGQSCQVDGLSERSQLKLTVWTCEKAISMTPLPPGGFAIPARIYLRAMPHCDPFSSRPFALQIFVIENLKFYSPIEITNFCIFISFENKNHIDHVLFCIVNLWNLYCQYIINLLLYDLYHYENKNQKLFIPTFLFFYFIFSQTDKFKFELKMLFVFSIYLIFRPFLLFKTLVYPCSHWINKLFDKFCFQVKKLFCIYCPSNFTYHLKR